MSKKLIPSIIFVVIVVIVALLITLLSSSKSDVNQTSASLETINSSTEVSTSTLSATYSMSEVAKHKTPADCWTTINGGVYRLTTWIAQHPGGEEAIIGLCGIDGSVAFNKQHGGQRKPENTLVTFKIGTLTQ